MTLAPQLSLINDKSIYTDATFDIVRFTDPLGLVRQGQIIEKQTEALSKPDDYIKKRNDAIVEAQKRVYEAWGRSMGESLTKGAIEPIARQKADAIATGMWSGEMAAIENEFPLSALGLATSSKLADTASKYDLNQKKLSMAEPAAEITVRKRRKPRKKSSTRATRVASLRSASRRLRTRK
jgi:hypothetical protein